MLLLPGFGGVKRKMKGASFRLVRKPWVLPKLRGVWAFEICGSSTSLFLLNSAGNLFMTPTLFSPGVKGSLFFPCIIFGIKKGWQSLVGVV